MFSIYINDLPINLKKNSRYSLLFADDLVQLYIFKNTCKEDTINKELETNLNNLEKWCSNWRLEIATEKCHYIVHKKPNNKTKKLNENKISIKMYNKELKKEKTAKFLGIRIDENLSFEDHCNFIKSTCLKRINILKIISHKSWQLTIETRKNIYKSLVRSIIEYSSILQPILRCKETELLNLIQNNSLRIINNKKLIDKVSIKMLEESSKIENLGSRLNTLRNRFIEKAKSSENPLIIELINDYYNYRNGRNVTHKSLFDKTNIDRRNVEYMNVIDTLD